MHRFADGYPDRGGECSWISSAYELEALPALVIHPKGSNESSARRVPDRTWWGRLMTRLQDFAR